MPSLRSSSTSRGRGRNRALEADAPGIDVLLDDLGLDPRAKLEVMRYGKAKLVRMLQASPVLDRQLGAPIASSARRWRRSSTRPTMPTSDLAVPLALLHRRSTRLAPWVQELRRREPRGQLTQTIAELA